MPEVETQSRGQIIQQGTRLVLASGSPRRRELLSRWGLPFEVIASGDPEHPCELSPAELSLRHAQAKAQAIANRFPGQPVTVVGADTTIDLEGLSLGKPTSDDHAREMLRKLRGRSHAVITSLAVFDCSHGRLEAASVSTTVIVRDFSEKELEGYIASGEPHGKAGSYAIQGIGGSLISKVVGCFNNVVGLPLCELAGMFRRMDLEFPLPRIPCTTNTGTGCPRIG